MRRSYYLIAGCCWAVLCSAALSQEQDPSLLTLERIFSSREFAAERFGPARWTAGGSGYTTLESSEAIAGARDIVFYDPETGDRRVLVAAEQLTPAGQQSPLEIEDYSWSTGGSKLLVFTNSERVWRANTRGDYWVLDLETRKLRKLGGDAEESTLMFAEFSPDGAGVAYVRANNIYVEELESGRIVQLTSDGSTTIINGTFDWVYEEEFGLRDGFRWSPDGAKIAYWQLDASGIPDFYMINNTDSLYPRLIPVQYPKAGTTNSSCRVGIVSGEGGETFWFEPPGDPRQHYIARMDWAASSDEIAFQRLNRLQNTNEVTLGDAHSGRMTVVHTDHDDAWLDVVDEMTWLGGGERFVWVSERDGRRHAYVVSRDGEDVTAITPGDYDITSVEAVDEKGGWLYFTASPENAAQRYLYRTALDGQGSPERLSPAGMTGTHGYNISPDCRWAFHTYSGFDTPPVTSLIRLPGHEEVRVLAANIELRKKVQALKRSPVEFFRIDIGDGVELDGWCMKPYDFDPTRRYPVLFNVYGEPAGQTVLDRWRGSGYLWHLMLTQHGYVVMSVDNRGTPAPRGREWRKCVYRQIGILASLDQAAAAEAITRRRSWIDAQRIGIWGWSGGGSMTLNMMFRYPGIYKTGMSVAPVADQHYYDTIYQERYMGLPQDNPEGYRDGSPITFAHRLEGNLLIVHGTGDDNVHYQNCEAVVNELIRHNKRFTMMAYPNRSHGIYEGENTTRHLYELLTWYLESNLPPGAN